MDRTQEGIEEKESWANEYLSSFKVHMLCYVLGYIVKSFCFAIISFLLIPLVQTVLMTMYVQCTVLPTESYFIILSKTFPHQWDNICSLPRKFTISNSSLGTLSVDLKPTFNMNIKICKTRISVRSE